MFFIHSVSFVVFLVLFICYYCTPLLKLIFLFTYRCFLQYVVAICSIFAVWGDLFSPPFKIISQRKYSFLTREFFWKLRELFQKFTFKNFSQHFRSREYYECHPSKFDRILFNENQFHSGGSHCRVSGCVLEPISSPLANLMGSLNFLIVFVDFIFIWSSFRIYFASFI